MQSTLVENYKNIDVASNEIFTRTSLNRNFKKLFENDSNIIKEANKIYDGMYRVLPWDENKSYNKDDLVWFVDFYLSPQKMDEYNTEYKKLEERLENTEYNISFLKNKYYTTTLYLLRSAKNNNTSMPVCNIIDMVPSFENSNWINENPTGSIYTDYFDEFTVYNLKNQLYKMHESVVEYHKFGKLSSFSELDNRVLKDDLSNIDPNRKCLFFPNTSYELKPTANILENSYVRVWDCGLIEYDIFFKLGNSESITNSMFSFNDRLSANNINLSNKGILFSEHNSFDNSLYYLTEEDATIFQLKNGITVTDNNIEQHNINNYVNAFSAEIVFPTMFIDTNYMIYINNEKSSILHDTETIVSNVNNMVFINKSQQSVTALLIISNYNNSDTQKVLGRNKFRCQIIGRWK